MYLTYSCQIIIKISMYLRQIICSSAEGGLSTGFLTAILHRALRNVFCHNALQYIIVQDSNADLTVGN